MSSSNATAPSPRDVASLLPIRVEKSATHLMLLQMVAGAGAGAVAKTATAPLERIKIIFQVQVRRFVFFAWDMNHFYTYDSDCDTDI